MDDQLSTGVREKNTTPVMSAIAQNVIDVDDDDVLNRVSVLLSQKPQRRGFFRRTGQAIRAYLTALVITLPMLPIIASAVTVGVYLSNTTAPGWNTVLYGMLYSYFAWWIITLFLVPLTSAKNSNARSYGLLVSRIRQLETRLFVINDLHHANPQQPLAEYQEVALQEALDKFDDLNNDLNDDTMRLPWVMGFGYVNAWTRLHRAEEALVEVEPVEMTMRGAMHDKMALTGSQVGNRDELLAKMLYAVKKLDPPMASLFKPQAAPATPGENENPDIQQLLEDVQKIAHHLKVNLAENHTSELRTPALHDGEDEARARLTLREVRRALNAYRDHLFEGLIRARNNLLGTMFVAGFVTHLLLCVVILAMVQGGPASDVNRATLAAATGYYIVGAIAGLFGRINQAAIANTAVDDYGFSFAQMISTPLLSGLAGIGGVLISSALTSFTAQHGLTALQSIFTQTQPDTFIIAAFFGLTPNLLVRGLQNRASGYIAGLRASKTTTADTNMSTGDGQSTGE
ncbi:MAG: hypothetical protein ACRDIV_14930 [Ktedonobacteraceae bacterium]